MSQVEDLRGFVTQRLTAVSQEILSAVDRVVAGYEAEASGFRQEIERQKNMLNVLLQPRVALNKTGDQQLLTIKVEEHPELITSLDQENPESLHVKEEKPLTTPEFFPTSVHVKNEDEEPQSLQPYRRQTEAEPPSSSSAEQMEADGDDCGGPEPARNSKTVAKVEDSDDDWNNKNGDQQPNPDSLHVKEEKGELLTTPTFSLAFLHEKSEDEEEEKPQSLQPQAEPEPARNSHQPEDLQPDPDDEVSESPCVTEDSEDDNDDDDDDDDGRETRAPEPGLISETVHVSGKEFKTGKKSHCCSECGKTFKAPWDLKTHMRVHTGERPFDCDTCGKKFKQRQHLLEHVRMHTGEKPFECATCGKKFSHDRSLKEHMRLHTGERPYKCTTCGKKFGQRETLKDHIKLHTKDKPFDYAICGKTIPYKKNIKVHMRTHKGEKLFDCATCGKTFSHKISLKEHIRCHTGEKPYECTTCGKQFRYKGNLVNHTRLHTWT